MGGTGTGGRWTPRPLSNGEPCDVAADCASGFCADGVCCNVACEGDCVHCDETARVGTCFPIPAGDHPKTAGACPVEIVETCGNDGTCDGEGACRLKPVNTPCGGGTCDGDAVVGRNVCDGLGHCRTGATQICVPFTCNPATAACRTGCTTDADCAGGVPCMNGSCRRPLEQPCLLDTECLTGHCVQGVCCNTACDGPCLACNLTGRAGTCTPLPSGTTCGQPTCAAGRVTGLKRCDTAANCVDWATETCDPFTCDPATQLCRTTCAADPDCVAPYVCTAGSCGRREGPTCDNGGQCNTGFCSRGICCDKACDDPCHTCSLPGSIGVCQFVPTGCGMGSDGGLP